MAIACMLHLPQPLAWNLLTLPPIRRMRLDHLLHPPDDRESPSGEIHLRHDRSLLLHLRLPVDLARAHPRRARYKHSRPGYRSDERCRPISGYHRSAGLSDQVRSDVSGQFWHFDWAVGCLYRVYIDKLVFGEEG